MKYRQILVTVIIALLFLSISRNMYVSANTDYNDSNLSIEEVNAIINNHPTIVELTEQLQNIAINPEINNGLWYVVIWGSNEEDTVLITVIIDDLTGKVVSFNYSADLIPSTRGDRLLAQSYFESLAISSFFDLENFEITTREKRNEFIVNGIQENREFTAFIGYNRSNDGIYLYQINKLQANFQFETPSISFEQANSVINTIPEIQDYIASYPNYLNETYEILYFESAYHSHPAGYVYNYEYSLSRDLTAIYTNNSLSIINEYQYNENKLENDISLDATSLESINAEMNASSGDIEKLDSSVIGNYNITQLMNLIFNDESITSWINSIPQFGGYLEYSGNRLFTLYFNSEYTNQRGFVKINDSSGDIVEINLEPTIIPITDKIDIFNLVELEDEFSTWKSNIINFQKFSKFNNTGIWTIVYYDPIIPDNSLVFQVNDTTQTILHSNLQLQTEAPNLSSSEIMASVDRVEFNQFSLDFPDGQVVTYYNSNGIWNLYAFSSVFPGKYLRLSIEDETEKSLGTNVKYGLNAKM